MQQRHLHRLRGREDCGRRGGASRLARVTAGCTCAPRALAPLPPPLPSDSDLRFPAKTGRAHWLRRSRAARPRDERSPRQQPWGTGRAGPSDAFGGRGQAAAAAARAFRLLRPKRGPDPPTHPSLSPSPSRPAMNGAGPERFPPVKLRRLHVTGGTDPTAAVALREMSPPAVGRGKGSAAHARNAGAGHAHSGGGRAGTGGGGGAAASLRRGLETPVGPKGGLETAVTCCLEQGRRSKGGLETPSEVTGGLETTGRPKGSLETAITHCLEQGRKSKGGLETTSEVAGSLETTTGPKGSLETAVTCCLEQGRRSSGGLETTSGVTGSLGPDASLSRSLKTISRCKRGLKAATGAKGSPEPPVTHCLDQGRSGKGGLETTAEPEGSLETTATISSERSQGGRRVSEPKGGPAPSMRQKNHSLEDCSVISLNEDEEEEEEVEGPRQYLVALEAVQLELEAVEEEAAHAFRHLHTKFWLRRQPHLQRRNCLIQHIPGFWVTAFLNHPQLSAMISDRDEDVLSYMTSLEVEEFGDTQPGCRIKFFFSINPYFQNDVVAKEFVHGPSGHLVSRSTPIRWWQGQDPCSRPHKGPPAPRSFFAWFGDHSFPARDHIADIIKEELWPNPLQFYLLGEGAEGTPERESGEDCVVIVDDDDEDVQEIPDDGDGSGVEEILTEEPPSPPDGRADTDGDRD